MGGGDVSSLSGAVGSLIGIRSRGGDSSSRVISILKSKSFINKFVKDNEIEKILFSSWWDEEKQIWKQRETSFLTKTKDQIFTSFNDQYESFIPDQPTQWQIYRAFDEIISVNQNLETGVTKIYMSWSDPQLAVSWTNLIVDYLNDHIKTQDISDANKSIEYLRKEIERASLVDMQNVLFRLVEEQIKIITLSETREQYAFKVIDPAIVPDSSVSPNRKIIVILGVFLGVVLGVLISLLFAFITQLKRQEN
jgi:uncharacterized protein involved in exopolysaccharide biosynthesis